MDPIQKDLMLFTVSYICRGDAFVMRMRIPNARHYAHDRATPVPERNEYQRDAPSAWQPKIHDIVEIQPSTSII